MSIDNLVILWRKLIYVQHLRSFLIYQRTKISSYEKSGSSENNQVFVRNMSIRGLCSSQNWELPLYLDFDKKAMKKSLLFQIISEAEERSEGKCQVWAIILNVEKDKELIEELGLNEEISYFLNPVDSSRKVYCFADVFTLTKLQRKHIIEDGIKIKSDCKGVIKA